MNMVSSAVISRSSNIFIPPTDIVLLGSPLIQVFRLVFLVSPNQNFQLYPILFSEYDSSSVLVCSKSTRSAIHLESGLSFETRDIYLDRSPFQVNLYLYKIFSSL